MLAKVNYKGFIWPLIIGIGLFLLTPLRPATITVAGWHMFAIFLATIIACIGESNRKDDNIPIRKAKPVRCESD